MPRKKKNYKKRSNYPRYKTVTNSRAPGMPLTRTAKLRYVDTIPINSDATGGLQSFAYRANGLFDPYVPLGGHQPMGYDTWATLYNHYVVTGSKITVQVQSSVNPALNSTVVGLYLADDTSVPYSSITGFMEANKGTYRIMSNTQTRPATCTSTFSAKKYFNLTDVKDNVTRLGSNVVSDPDEQAFFVIYHAPTYQGNATLSLNLIVTIEYMVHFSEPKDLIQS